MLLSFLQRILKNCFNGDFDALIIGGGVAGMQCALLLGSAKEKAFAADKKVGIIMHQKASHLQNAFLTMLWA